MPEARPPFARLLRHWRSQRGQSQLALSTEAGVSTRHLSFLETGRAAPSREMVLRLAVALDVPLRERNVLLAAAGFAAAYRETDLDAPEMAMLRRMLDFLLDLSPSVHSCPPGASGRRAARPGTARVATELLTGLHRKVSSDGADPERDALLAELTRLPGIPARAVVPDLSRPQSPVLPLHLKRGGLELRLFTAVTQIASPQDVTLDGLRIESFMPADAASEAAIRQLADEG